MKEYHSIPRFQDARKFLGAKCIAFRKEDGSQIRVEYAKKQWKKFGSRTRLIDESHEHLGQVIPLFREQWEENLTKVLVDNKIPEATIFMEFFGPNSFAGLHEPNDTKILRLFDVNVYKKGMMPPREFLRMVGHLDVAEKLYEGLFDEDFIRKVQVGEFPVVEGVVCKEDTTRFNPWMAKVKTFAYLKKLAEHNLPE